MTPNSKPTPSWHLSGSYSYLHVMADNRPGFTNLALRDAYRGQSPTHHIRGHSRMDLLRGLEASPEIFITVDSNNSTIRPDRHNTIGS